MVSNQHQSWITEVLEELDFIRFFEKNLNSSTESGIVPNIWQEAHPLLQIKFYKIV